MRRHPAPCAGSFALLLATVLLAALPTHGAAAEPTPAWRDIGVALTPLAFPWCIDGLLLPHRAQLGLLGRRALQVRG